MTASTTVLELRARCAADLMTRNPVSIYAGSTLENVVQTLTEHRFGAMPVVNATGRVVGVVSRTDVVRAVNQQGRPRLDVPASGEVSEPPMYTVKARGSVHVEDIMTPRVFSVAPEASVPDLVREMAARDVHRLFVVDIEGILVGVISAIDVLRAVVDA